MPIPFKAYVQNELAYKGGKPKPETGDKKIYKLSSNENQLGASPKALKAIQIQLANIAEYPDPTDTRLRYALEKFYDGQLTAEQFITTNSGVANIDLILRGFMEEDTECIYCNPAFGPYAAFPKKLGARAIDIPLVGVNFHLNVKGILNAINDKTRLIFITNPNNPTGTHLAKKQIDDLIEGLPDNIVLVFDEVYYQYADASDYVRALPYVQAGKNVIGINSFSKAYGLAGLRIGYSYSIPKIADYLQRLRLPFMINTLSSEAAIAALEDTVFIEQTVALIQEEKQYLYQELDRLDCTYWKTQANFILIRPKIGTEEFERLMLQEGVMVRPVDGFGAPGCIRVTIGTREANEAFVNGWKKINKKIME